MKNLADAAIICAMERELEPLIKYAEDIKEKVISKYTFYTCTLEGVRAVLVCCGTNKVNAAVAAHIVCDRFSPRAVINTGVAGGMSREAEVCSVAVAVKCAYHDTLPDALTMHFPKMEEGIFYSDRALVDTAEKALGGHAVFGMFVTGEAFIEDEGREDIISRFNPVCVDNETVAVAHTCFLNDMPFIAIRAVSDSGENSGMDAYYKNCDSAAQRAAQAVREFLRQFK